MAVDLKTSLSQQLNKIVASISPEDVETTLSTLRKIFDNIIQCPNDDRYRQIKLANKTFNSKVWRYSACEKLMKMSGWVVVNDHVRLKDDSHVHTVSQLLESLHKAVTTTGPSVLGKRKRNDSVSTSVSEEVLGHITLAIHFGNGVELKKNTKSIWYLSCRWKEYQNPFCSFPI